MNQSIRLPGAVRRIAATTLFVVLACCPFSAVAEPAAQTQAQSSVTNGGWLPFIPEGCCGWGGNET